MRAVVFAILSALMLFLSGCTSTGDTVLISRDVNQTDINQTIIGGDSNYGDANVNARIAAAFPADWDANVSSKPSIVGKLIEGTNITLSCTGSDNNGECTINSTATGSANVDLNGYMTEGTFDGNFMQAFDSNILGYVSQADGNNWYVLVADSNNVGRLSYEVIADPPWGTGSGTGRTYTSGSASSIAVDNDANTISFILYVPTEADIDANALGVISGLDLNNSLLYIPVGTYIPSEIDIDNNVLGIVNSLDLNNSLGYLKSFSEADPFVYTRITDTYDGNWNRMFGLTAWNADFNANWLDLFTGQNISLLTNDSGYLTEATLPHIPTDATIDANVDERVQAETSDYNIAGSWNFNTPLTINDGIGAGPEGGTFTVDTDGNLALWIGRIYATDVNSVMVSTGELIGDLLPSKDSLWNLGAVGMEWLNAYIDNIYATTATLTGTLQATTAKLTNLTDGYVPYHVSDAAGLANSPVYTNLGNVWLNVMPGLDQEGIVKIGRADIATGSREHFIKAFNSGTAASNYLTFALHKGTLAQTIDVLTLKGNGNVIIGTSAVDNDITFWTGANGIFKIGRNTAEYLNMNFNASTIDLLTAAKTLQFGTSDAQALRLLTNNAVAMTISSGGVITTANNLTVGAGTAGTDYALTFDGETNNGILTWMEDEDYFSFNDGIMIPSTEQIYFRDTALHIDSLDDGHLDLTADTSIDLHGHVVLENGKTVTRGTYVVSKAIAYNSSGFDTVITTVNDGYVVTDVYVEITTAWDGDGFFTIGDGDDNDGFLTNTNINQGTSGYYGSVMNSFAAENFRGEYLGVGVGGSPERKIYTTTDTIDAYVTPGTSTQGAATVYVVIQKLK